MQVLEQEKYTMSLEYLCQKVRRCPEDERTNVKEVSWPKLWQFEQGNEYQ